MRARERSRAPGIQTSLDDWAAALGLPPIAIRVRVVAVAPRAADLASLVAAASANLPRVPDSHICMWARRPEEVSAHGLLIR